MSMGKNQSTELQIFLQKIQHNKGKSNIGKVFWGKISVILCCDSAFQIALGTLGDATHLGMIPFDNQGGQGK